MSTTTAPTPLPVRPPRAPEAPDPVLDAPRPATKGAMLFGAIVMVGFFGGFMAWATQAPLAEAAIAPGVIKVEGQRRTLQHLEGGVVREILVRDGDRVRAGQVVMRLDGIQADTAREALRAQHVALLAQSLRLAAEAAGERELIFPPAMRDSAVARTREAMAGQTALFLARQASLESQLAVIQTRETQARATIAAAEGQLRAARRQLELIVQEEAMRRGLMNQGLSRLTELLAVQRARAGIEGQLDELQGTITRAEAAIEEARGQARAARDQRLQEVGAEARDVATRLTDVEERLRAADDVAERREILAPEEGVVVNLRLFTVGGVVRPGDPVMDLVPTQDRLVAELNVQPMDIDVVHPGLRAEIRLPAFRQRLVPYLDGTVTFVAADVTIDPQTRASHYRAFIEIDREQLARLPGVFLTPGMPVEGHIMIGQRTFWRYITQPLRDSLHRAFSEP
ncbi:MAG: HlyD family type I secretion periplasmic adaptor subunit [Rubritepida sp.]|jgi:HlyD family type I secretion membrane fusion protein|nr:HlyD family type I secretion periplasmic adaptor subunit [Rubritepida sp.]MCU0946203.1 HlyD family type I secretion periplasmic adaptor subunit [Rubritepida sp.]